ncbi:hypothetical protein N0V86_005159 [Didymella sp. IMI 355093]|nr:hypothetical protein N0V86_005159 [Didymella sp. IMI 355093]
MSSFGDYNFIAGDEDLELHQSFCFTEVTETTTAADASASAEDLPAPPLASPFAGPLEDLQGQTVGWLSPSSHDPVDGLDAIDFNDFLAFDESTDDLSAAAQVVPAATPPPELAASSTPQDESTAALEPAEDLPAVAQLDAVRDEIAQLKAALAAEGLQSRASTIPGGRQSSSGSLHKRRLDGGEVSPPKRQTTTKMGPIEALWSPKVTVGEQRAVNTNLAPPATPKPFSPQLDFTAQPSTPPIHTQDGHAISSEDLRSIQQFLNDNPAPVYGPSQQVDITTPPSDINMGHLVNTNAKRVPLKQTTKHAPKTTTNATNKVTKTTPKKKTRHQRTAPTTSNITLSPASSTSYRSIDELLAANFYSINAQEKLRLMLPMLRNLNPRELEKNLAALPCIRSKGTGHEVHVAKAIKDSPPTPEADDILAARLTFGTPSSPTPAAKGVSSSRLASTAPALQNLLLSHGVAHVGVSEDHDAARQCEALKKAAVLQTQVKKG